jgi:hypothetical protein
VVAVYASHTKARAFEFFPFNLGFFAEMVDYKRAIIMDKSQICQKEEEDLRDHSFSGPRWAR